MIIRRQNISFSDGLPVIMTEKDAIKCREFATRNQKDAIKCREFATRNHWAVIISVDVDQGILMTVLEKIKEFDSNG